MLFPSKEAEEFIEKLRAAKIKYDSRVGTYYEGRWKEINENKIASSAMAIASLLSFYDVRKYLTPPQIVFAEKLIKNSNQLS